MCARGRERERERRERESEYRKIQNPEYRHARK